MLHFGTKTKRFCSASSHFSIGYGFLILPFFASPTEQALLLTMNLKPISFLLGLAVSQIAAQDLLASPTTKWEQQLFGASGNAQFSYGNGVFLTPDESEVVAVGTDGKVTAYAAGDGAFSWDFDPPAVADGASNTIRSLSGMTFTTDRSPSSYMVYAISYESVLDTDSDYT